MKVAIYVINFVLILLVLSLSGCNQKNDASEDDQQIIKNPDLPNVILQVADPLFSSEGGSKSENQMVYLKSSTEGALIYYTTDGTDPSQSNGMLYDGHPIVVEGNGTAITIKGVAVKSGFVRSNIVKQSYIINYLQVSTPSLIYPNQSIYYDEVLVSVQSTTGSNIFYTTDGSTPTNESIPYNNQVGIVLKRSTTLKVLAQKDGLLDSIINSHFFAFKVKGPIFSDYSSKYDGISVVGPITISLTTGTPEANIVYTIDGSDPALTGIEYSSPINISSSLVLRIRAIKEGYESSNIVTYQFQLRCSNPLISPSGGTILESTTVNISSPTEGCMVHYTIDGTDPNESHGGQYTGPIVINKQTRIRAVAFKDGLGISNITNADFGFEALAGNITFSPSSSVTYNKPINVLIEHPDSETSIYYTVDGSEPSIGNGIKYSGEILVTFPTRIRAIATKPYHNLVIASTHYSFLKTNTPVFSLVGYISFTGEQKLDLTCSISEAIIKYTIDGTTPSRTAGLVYNTDSGIILDKSVVVKTIAFKDGYATSDLASREYTFRLPEEPILPTDTALYEKSVTVSMSTAEKAIIKYTLDGSDVNCSSGLVYSTPFVINKASTIRAIGCREGWQSSPQARREYAITSTSDIETHQLIKSFEFVAEVGQDGSIHIAYNKNNLLYYAYQSNEQSNWIITQTSFNVNRIYSIAIDSGNKPHVLFSTESELKYAKKGSADELIQEKIADNLINVQYSDAIQKKALLTLDENDVPFVVYTVSRQLGVERMSPVDVVYIKRTGNSLWDKISTINDLKPQYNHLSSYFNLSSLFVTSNNLPYIEYKIGRKIYRAQLQQNDLIWNIEEKDLSYPYTSSDDLGNDLVIQYVSVIDNKVDSNLPILQRLSTLYYYRDYTSLYYGAWNIDNYLFSTPDKFTATTKISDACQISYVVKDSVPYFTYCDTFIFNNINDSTTYYQKYSGPYYNGGKRYILSDHTIHTKILVKPDGKVIIITLDYDDPYRILEYKTMKILELL